ncbi:RNA polymerase sigma factor [Gaoshiqia sp. Z1-71]|uniref:RNA polymerase sigma factor n=1 Tax=Gaoshiqia hydrogeniformans TaxID=3290090 RepID=UPI003BF7DD93
MEKEFVKIITENQGIIHKVCSVYCDSEEDRRDLFQEIVTQLWKSYPSFRFESKFTTWMYRVALNTAITSFKKNKRQPDKHGVEMESVQIATEEYDPEVEEQMRLLNQAISQLSGIEKSIVLLFLENKKYEEIAEITGITQNYVRVKMNRIKHKLKKIMDREV